MSSFSPTVARSGSSPWQRLIDALPQGAAQPEEVWRKRHHGILVLLVVHAFGLFAFGVARGQGPGHAALEASVPLVAVLIASQVSTRRMKALVASFGLIASSSILVHFSGGSIEAHFHFFVVLPIIALYQDWTPFLVAIGYVVVHHGLMGALAPDSVFNHPAAINSPWIWAGIHGLFVLAESAAVIVAWRLSEESQLKAAAYSERLIEQQARALEQHRSAEAALKEAEQRYRRVIEKAIQGVFQTTPAGKLEVANQALADILGYESPEQLRAEVADVTDLYVEESRRSDLFDRLRSDGDVRSFEAEVRRRDGRAIWISLSARADYAADGSILRVHGMIADITDRKAAELEQSLLAAIVNSHSDGIWSASLDQIVTSWNPGAERMFGYTSDEMKGRDLSVLLPDRADDMGYVLEDLERGESREHLERVRRTKSGELMDVALTLAPIFDRDGRVTGFSTVCRDIRHRKNNEMQRALLEDRVRQSQKMEAVGQLAGGIAHDFNNLLSVILNFTGFVTDQLPEGDQRRDDLEEVIRAAERGSNLTRQLLTFARKDVARVSRVDLNEVIAGMQQLFNRTLQESIEVSITAAPDLRPVEVDVSRIEQILMNLAVNARDAMARGGRFDIATENVTVTLDVMELHPGLRQGDYIKLTVSDTGAGIPRDVQERVFEPFFTTKEVGQGTGLGLATTYAIVTEAGGDIALYSEPGKGTTFTIYLPATEAGPGELRLPDAELPSGGRGETVLVVEDSRSVRRLAERILERNGYVVVTATDGEEAIRRAEETAIDVMLSDVVMPGMSAQELGSRLGKPMVFMSGYTDRIIAQHGLLDDRAEFLQKPFTADQLLIAVRRALDLSARSSLHAPD